MEKSCPKCASRWAEKQADFTHVVFNKSITICNVPYYECVLCGNIVYSIQEVVEAKLSEAFSLGMTHIEFH